MTCIVCLFCLSLLFFISSQEPPPGTDLYEGSYCWKCNGLGYLYTFFVVIIFRREVKRKRKDCSVCHGNKIIISEKRRNVFNQPGVIMPDRRYLLKLS